MTRSTAPIELALPLERRQRLFYIYLDPQGVVRALPPGDGSVYDNDGTDACDAVIFAGTPEFARVALAACMPPVSRSRWS